MSWGYWWYNSFMLYKIIAIVAALLTSSGFLPQMIKGFQTKQLKDVSTFTLLLSGTGTALWAIYGFSLGDMIIICANLFTCSTLIVLLVMQRMYSK